MQAILFDLDETIILDEPISKYAFSGAAELAADRGADPARLAHDALAAARRLWAEGPVYDYCLRIGHSAVEGLWARYDRGDHPATAKLAEWAPRYRAAMWQEAMAAQGLPADEGLTGALAARFVEFRRRYPRYPDFNQVMAALRTRGYKFGIVTNGVPDLQREKLAGCGVAHLFHASVVSGEIDCGKPDPGIFRHICRELGVALDQCVMVGDNPERDVAGAINAGMKSVWVQRDGRPRDERFPADLECTDLSAMLPWLDQLEGA